MIEIIREIFRLSNFNYVNIRDYNKLDIHDYNYENRKQIEKVNLTGISKIYRIDNYIDNIAMFVPSNQSKKIEYFIVINLKDPTANNLDKLIEDGFNSIYSYIKSSEDYDTYMEKNTSLIILLETTERDSNFNRKIFDIEENKYNFKKYVITYTKSQLEKLQELYRQGDDLLKKTNKIIYDTDEFTGFKSNPLENSLYNIVSKLYIKLPFLKLNPEEKELSSLESDIKSKISSDEKIDKDIVRKIIDSNDIDLKNLSEEEILSMVKGVE